MSYRTTFMGHEYDVTEKHTEEGHLLLRFQAVKPNETPMEVTLALHESVQRQVDLMRAVTESITAEELEEAARHLPNPKRRRGGRGGPKKTAS